jgi:hypothetical protein
MQPTKIDPLSGIMYPDILEADTIKTFSPPVPHSFETLVESLDANRANPVIKLTKQAWLHMYAIIRNCGDDEISWLGCVDEKDGVYTIDDIFIVHQTVDFAETEIDEKKMGQFYSEYIKKNPENGAEKLSKILFWGHVHPGDSTSPSQQDEDQMSLFAHNKYFIRGIFTRHGRGVFDFYDYKAGIRIIDCPWEVDVGVDINLEKSVKDEIKKKVKKSPIPTWSRNTKNHKSPPPFTSAKLNQINQLRDLINTGMLED